jgi:hypothetical protein
MSQSHKPGRDTVTAAIVRILFGILPDIFVSSTCIFLAFFIHFFSWDCARSLDLLPRKRAQLGNQTTLRRALQSLSGLLSCKLALFPGFEIHKNLNTGLNSYLSTLDLFNTGSITGLRARIPWTDELAMSLQPPTFMSFTNWVQRGMEDIIARFVLFVALVGASV